MDFKDAAHYRLAYGVHAGEIIDDIGASDEGLMWLDFMRGQYDQRLKPGDKPIEFHAALRTYLDDATIAKDLASVIAQRRH